MQTLTVYLLVICCLAIQNTWAKPVCNPQWSNEEVETSYHKHKYNKIEHKETNQDTLKLCHVVFRHGDRTPDKADLYPKDPYLNYTYYPVGLGQLTNLGKKQEYLIGVALRERYGEFLGDIYTPEVLDALSTDYNRTKASLELSLAGLWPPVREQIWYPALLWQPIPYNYVDGTKDQLLGDPSVTCPRYRPLFEENQHNLQNTHENAKFKDFYEYINFYTGLNTSTPEDIYNLYFALRAEEGLGLPLPKWTKCVWPEKITQVAVKYYEMMTQTPELRQLSGGWLLEKIIKDSNDKRTDKLNPPGRKLFLYSSHERNVALMLIVLGVYYPHVPPYGSYVLIELHEIAGQYGFKVFYQDYADENLNPNLLVVPGCESFCPYDKFYKIVKDNLPVTSCSE